jgi:Ca2+-binding RTX toxin-like protein
VLFINHHVGEAADPENPFCGSGDFPDTPPIVVVCTTHRAGHAIFGYPQENSEDVPYDPAVEPDLGERGADVSANDVFDGWGYARLFENGEGKMREIDQYALQEGMNPDFAFGFGDLSIHEFATDPTENVAYSSYYAGGMRVFNFGDGGLFETGRFIDEGGNNFWGVEVFTTPQGDRLFAGSDRDFGLYLFRYTGPGAAQKPVCIDTTVFVPYRASADVPLPCTDANGNPLDRSILSGPSNGTVSGNPDSGTVSYQNTSGPVGASDSLTFMANDGAANSNTATLNIVVVAREDGACFNAFSGDDSDDRLVGSPFGDELRGAGGRDVIQGLEGDDCLLGQADRDSLEGDIGDDRLVGGRAKDRMFGGSGDDRLVGNRGRDHLLSGSGNDRLSGGSRADFLDGGSNNDRVVGGRGGDQLRGGPGRDRIRGGTGDDSIEGGDARNRISAGAGDDKVYTVNDRVDRVRCGPGDDEVLAEDVDIVSDDCETVQVPR